MPSHVYVIELSPQGGSPARSADPVGLRRLERSRTGDPLRTAPARIQVVGSRPALRRAPAPRPLRRPGAVSRLRPPRATPSSPAPASSRGAASSPTATAPPTAWTAATGRSGASGGSTPIGPHVDAAAAELIESAFEPLDPERLRAAALRRARLLGFRLPRSQTTRRPPTGSSPTSASRRSKTGSRRVYSRNEGDC